MLFLLELSLHWEELMHVDVRITVMSMFYLCSEQYTEKMVLVVLATTSVNVMKNDPPPSMPFCHNKAEGKDVAHMLAHPADPF